jgi:hypothetical protein
VVVVTMVVTMKSVAVEMTMQEIELKDVQMDCRYQQMMKMKYK